MKKLVFLLLILVLMIPCAIAESIDLSSLSFDDLAALRDRIQLEMMARDEWQEVTVPGGLWEVGKDIPAGSWVVRCAGAGVDSYLLSSCRIAWGKGKPYEESMGIWMYGGKGDVEIYNPNNNYYEGETVEYIVSVEVGDFIYIDPDYNQAVFTPYTGKPNFVFK